MINLRLVCGLCSEEMQKHTTLRMRAATVDEAAEKLTRLAFQYGWGAKGEEFCCTYHNCRLPVPGKFVKTTGFMASPLPEAKP